VVTQSIVAEGDGLWREYAGGYADWLTAKARAPRATSLEGQKNNGEAASVDMATNKRELRSKLSYREIQELALLPDRITAAEREQAEIALRLADAALYRDAPDLAKQLQERAGQLDGELEQLMRRWEELELRVA
ncbi:MAG: ABC transporter ATP-binding protein, partial [Proteobacteria bacterium]|nr:ABC transporter ATP-binding protein [Pseudomonadota bacterium]